MSSISGKKYVRETVRFRTIVGLSYLRERRELVDVTNEQRACAYFAQKIYGEFL